MLVESKKQVMPARSSCVSVEDSFETERRRDLFFGEIVVLRHRADAVAAEETIGYHVRRNACTGESRAAETDFGIHDYRRVCVDRNVQRACRRNDGEERNDQSIIVPCSSETS